MKRYIYRMATALLAMLPAAAFAQLSGEVAVEGEYDPLVIETDRLNEYPVAYRFELPQITLDYDTEGRVADFNPTLMTMGVTGWNTRLGRRIPHGYVDFRMGSFLNTRLDAGYWILRDSVNTLSANLKFESTSLYRIHGVPDTFSEPARRKLYDGTLGLDYSRLVGRHGLFNAGVDYRCGYFNYYGSVYPYSTAPPPSTKVPTQTVNQFGVRARFTSDPSPLRGWHAGASLGYMAYRDFTYPDYTLGLREKGDRETHLNLEGGYAFALSDISAITLDADADILLYPKRDIRFPGYDVEGRKNYGVVSVTPAYRIGRGGFNLTAGLDLDLSFNAMGSAPGEKFGFFHVAPNVGVDYRTRQFGFYLTATGGVTPVTLAGMEMFDRYQMPMLVSTQPIYSPVDARLGLCFGPYAGFSADLTLRYAVANNTPMGGWYQALMNVYGPESDVWRVNLHGASMGIDLRYALSGVLETRAEACFTPQHGKFGIFNGYDRPKVTADASVAVYPGRKLRVEAGYGLRALRRIYMPQADDPDRLEGLKLRNMSMLRAKVGYMLWDTFELYIAGDNLLNRRIDILPGLQCNGIALSGGLYWEF